VAGPSDVVDFGGPQRPVKRRIHLKKGRRKRDRTVDERGKEQSQGTRAARVKGQKSLGGRGEETVRNFLEDAQKGQRGKHRPIIHHAKRFPGKS